MVASATALWVRFGRGWWPASPLEKAAYRVACPACPFDVAAGRPAAHTAIGLVVLCATLYAVLGVGIETARRMRASSD